LVKVRARGPAYVDEHVSAAAGAFGVYKQPCRGRAATAEEEPALRQQVSNAIEKVVARG
jgi:hypothetical protein